MLSVGGISTFNSTAAPCDPEAKGVEIFDMSSGTFGSFYNMSAPSYTVPSAVVANIGGT